MLPAINIPGLGSIGRIVIFPSSSSVSLLPPTVSVSSPPPQPSSSLPPPLLRVPPPPLFMRLRRDLLLLPFSFPSGPLLLGLPHLVLVLSMALFFFALELGRVDFFG
ncbi:hypothetical protein PAXINDRAFT_13247 [Paxillus involutus ATCC 200175]|uniref:Uncharacterized protein n=1 Tax=Paxillus involutus ATCC 200175 TaxID=664439 RepID=A0A0C9SWH3_PAXIN|nr:hypothetical protein PAXINDRAFT_13247 [Paxillus involutus ATCC 200175]